MLINIGHDLSWVIRGFEWQLYTSISSVSVLKRVGEVLRRSSSPIQEVLPTCRKCSWLQKLILNWNRPDNLIREAEENVS